LHRDSTILARKRVKCTEFGVIRVLFGQFGANRTVEELDEAVEREATAALKCGPGAVAEAKKLIRFVSTHDARENLDGGQWRRINFS
jgi:hypothetical protein